MTLNVDAVMHKYRTRQEWSDASEQLTGLFSSNPQWSLTFIKLHEHHVLIIHSNNCLNLSRQAVVF